MWIKEEIKQNVGAAPSQKNGIWRVKTEGRKEAVEQLGLNFLLEAARTMRTI